MKNVIVLMSIVLISLSSLFSQGITFETGVTIFQHPSVDDPLIFNPFLPLNLNNDNAIDFIGTFEDGFDEGISFFTSDDGVLNLSTVETSDVTTVAQVIDYNGDGLDDVLFRDGVWINGEGNDRREFALPEEFDPILVRDEYIGIADFNSDEMHDILVRRRVSGGDDDLAILMSDGQGEFANVTLNTQPDIGDINIIDVNGDGFLDVAVVRLDPFIEVSSIDIYYGDGAGEFNRESLDNFSFGLFGGSIFSSLEFADLDADGDLDILFPTFDGIVTIENLGSQEGASEFSPPSSDQVFEFSTSVIAIRLGDMNMDGLPDIIGVGALNEIYYGENDGNGSFIELEVANRSGGTDYIYPQNHFIALSHTTNNFTLCDFDSDGDLDILYLNHDSEDFLFFENRPLSTSTNDLKLSDIEFGPNPSFDFITLTGSDTQEVDSYRIYDNMGRLVQNGSFQSDRLNLVGLANGSYILQLFDRNKELFLNEKIVFIGSR